MSEAVTVAGLVFLAGLLQATLFTSIDLLGGAPDLLLVVLVAIAILRGAAVGSVAGFAGGLVFDLATLGTLGVTSLVLTIAGYWAGRYGETTGRDRPQALPLAVVGLTVLVAVAGYALHFVLGEEVSAGLLVRGLLPGMALNLGIALLLWPLLTRLLVRTPPPLRAREVEIGV